MKKDLQTLHEEFMKEMRYASKRSPSTLRGYQDAFKLLLKLMPGLSLSLLTSKTITAFFEKVQTRERKSGKATKHGVLSSTIQTYHNKLGSFFSWLKKEGHIKANPLAEVKKPVVFYENREYLIKKQVLQILAAINHGIEWPNTMIRKRNELMIYLCLGCGLRKTEMLSLKLTDIDLDKNLLTVNWQTSKSKMTRQIPISTQLRQRIKDYIAERNKAGYKTPYLIVSGTGDRQLTDNGLKHVLVRIIDGSGVKFHLHQLRHTFAVNYLLHNDLAKLKQLMGHKDIRMTARYLRCLPTDELRSSMEDITPDNLF